RPRPPAPSRLCGGPPFPFARQPLQPAPFVDDALEHAPHRGGVERPRAGRRDALQHLRLAPGRVDGDARRPLDAPDLDRAGRAAVEQADQLRVDEVDAPAPLLDRALGARVRGRGRAHIALFSHPTFSPRSPAGSVSRKRTSALPTTTPSATAAAAAACCGVEMPKPSATGD